MYFIQINWLLEIKLKTLTSNPHGKATKINLENKQLQISGPTQVTTVSQHTSIASKSSAITTAQYAK